MDDSTSKTNWSAFLLIILFVVILVGIITFVVLRAGKKNESASNQSASSQIANSGEVAITKDGFEPKVITIQKGGTITWTNKDTSPHQIMSDPHPSHDVLADLQLEAIGESESVQFKFEETGTFTYHDEKTQLLSKGRLR